MARYIGPKSKISRKFGEAIYGPDKAFEHKNFPPGMHGNSKRRKKVSEYGTQLKEKQKAKYMYGVLERQFRNLFEKAHSHKGVTGTVLLQLLESRLDNVVYRLGIAPSRAAARQLVSHKHIVINGSVVNIPSYTVRPGEVVSVREKSKSLIAITDCLATQRHNKFSWLEWDGEAKSGKFLNVPNREEIPENIRNN